MTFWTRVEDDLTWGNEILYAHPISRLSLTCLERNDDYFYGEPEDPKVDGYTQLEPLHEAMLYALDRHFGPTIEERDQLLQQRDDTLDRLISTIDRFAQARFNGEDPELVKRALVRAQDRYRRQ